MGGRLIWVGVVAVAAQFAIGAPALAGIGAPLKFNTTGQAQLHEPYGVTTDNLGNVYVADTGAHRVVKFDKDGNPLLIFGQGNADGSSGGQPGKLSYPSAITYANDHIYVVDASSFVNIFTTSGQPAGQFGGPGSGDGQLNVPLGMTTDCAGDIWVADSRNNRIVEFDGNGKWIKDIGVGEVGVPTGIAVQGTTGSACITSNVYVSDEYDGKVVVLQSNGQVVGPLGGPGQGELQFAGPESLALDLEPGTANETLWVAESGNFREQELSSTDGGLHWSFADFVYPEGKGNSYGDTHALALAPDGSLVVADTGGGLYDYPIKPPALKLLTFADHRSHVRDQEEVDFQVKYNQFEKTCTVKVTATVEVPNHAFTLTKRVDAVGTSYKVARLGLTSTQLGYLEKRWKGGHAVPVHSNAKGTCSDNIHASSEELDFKI